MSVATPPAPAVTGEPYQRLPLTVDSTRLLREVGALFGSIHSAASEILQNSYRAGATRLDVTTDEVTRTVCFVDNGPGLDQPEVLFSLASSGWDPSEVIAAAGMGAFAIFALSDRVVVDSYPASGEAWRAELTAEAFSGGDVLVSRLEPDPSRSGLSVTAVLAASTTFPKLADGTTWRHRYPLAVTVDGVELPLVPLTTPHATLSGPAIPTSVGTIQFANERHRTLLTGSLVWEHRLIKDSTHVMERVRKEASALAELRTGHHDANALVSSLLQGATLVWHVAPASGVRPKLPDRERLIEDAALTNAIAVMAEAVVSALSFTDIAATTRAWARTRGTTIITGMEHAILPQGVTGFGDLAGLTDSLFAGPAFRLAGLIDSVVSHAPNFDAEDDMNWEAADEGGYYASTPSDTSTAWVVTPEYRCASPYLVGIANALGLPTVDAEDESTLPLLELDFDRMLLVPETYDLFVENARFVCDGRTVAPLTETVSRYFRDGNANEENTEAYALTGRARELVQARGDMAEIAGIHPAYGEAGLEYIRGSKSYLHAALLALDMDGDLYDYVDGGDQSVDTDRLTRDAAVAYAAFALPARALGLRRIEAARNLTAALSSRFDFGGGSGMLLQEVQKLTEMGGSTPALDTLRVHLAAIQALWPDLSEVALSALPSPSGAPMAE